jgi:PadR family transcriptional regulator, regulatory protein PadR
MNADAEPLSREILLGLWKVHILHHAGEGAVVGQWMMEELRSHGYQVSPGTLYPLLQRMERNGWLRSQADPGAGPKGRREYYLTELGRDVLGRIRTFVDELQRELGDPHT